MSSPIAAMSGVLTPLQVAATTGGGTILALPPSFRNHTIIIKGASGVTAGAIQIETSDDPAFGTTTNAQVGGGPITVLASTEIAVEFTGIFPFIRANISTTISGGGSPSVSVNYLGAKSY